MSDHDLESICGAELTIFEDGSNIDLIGEAVINEAGKIAIPDRRIALGDFATHATLKVQLSEKELTQDNEYLTSYFSEECSRLGIIHAPDIFFNYRGQAYAHRNISFSSRGILHNSWRRL